MSFDPFIYGSDPTERVISVEVKDDKATIICQNGELKSVKEMENSYWILYSEPIDEHCIRLHGSLHYRWAKKFETEDSYSKAKVQARIKKQDHFTVYNPKEAFLIKSGVTYYLGMEPKDLSVLSFDIETTGIALNSGSKVLLISNTYRCGDKIERVLFSHDDYNSQKEMIYAWCIWVRKKDPSILTGHNIFNFDLPYLKHCAGKLPLGADESLCKFAKYPSKFRKDGSQSYDYKNVLVYGREVIDTFHLAIKYDVARNYPSYGLKAIIRHEGLEKEDRQHYDASQIWKDHEDPVKWAEIKKYAEHDADDALALFDLMIPAYFYYAQAIPKTLQQIINGASGSQVNAFMVRSYINEKHSLPAPTEVEHFAGGISFGHPGIYKNCYKVDVASLYPSIIRTFNVSDTRKDPKNFFTKAVDVFTQQRLRHKKLAAETGKRAYRDREQAEKILINSAYGFMGAPGLNFNSPKCAAIVTQHGRRILETGISFCEEKGFKIVNADTDSFMFHVDTPETFNFEDFIIELNSQFADGIVWEDDGIYERVLIVKAKNYILRQNGKDKIKGSALKATMKEPALREMLECMCKLLLEGFNDNRLVNTYNLYCTWAANIGKRGIGNWCSKKTVTKSVLKPNRSNESRIKEAIERAEKQVQEGDKIKVFFKTQTELALEETFDGTYDVDKLLEKVFKTVKILEPVLDLSLFPNYKLKRNKEAFRELCERSSGDNQGLYEAQTGVLGATKGVIN